MRVFLLAIPIKLLLMLAGLLAEMAWADNYTEGSASGLTIEQIALPSEVAKSTDQQAIELGKKAATALLQSLKQTLTQAVSSQGLESAIDMCSAQALPLTHEVAEKMAEQFAGPIVNKVTSDKVTRDTEKSAVASQQRFTVVSLKRTSTRYRNPLNAPSVIEQRVLQSFEQAEQRGEALPAYQLQYEGDTVYYFQAISVGALCLGCHGDSSTIPTTVAARLQQRYPDDKAKGYRLGEFRGLVSVGMSRQAAVSAKP